MNTTTTYVLGIVADRLADHAFGRAANRIRRRYFATDDEYHTARRTIVVHAEPMYRLRQYGRSRMRICRGRALNSALLLVPAAPPEAREGIGAGEGSPESGAS